jgi:adenine-specific DNA-methyltransferase
MGKEYEGRVRSSKQFVDSHRALIPLAINALKDGGSLCWQVGSNVVDGVTTPLDYLVFQLMQDFPEMRLRNRIVWTFGHGLHCSNRFSGRHEVVLWFTKGQDYKFFLDNVRVSQKYPGKRHSKGPNKGQPSGNPLGKNPGDVWDIPNVKSRHIEKTIHPCQFPVALAQRLVRGLTKKGDLVVDPFCGVASAGVAAVVEGRRFLGAELNKKYVDVAVARLEAVSRGEVIYRPIDRPIHVPSPNSKVASVPQSFTTKRLAK